MQSKQTHINDHSDCGESGTKILWVRRPDGDWNTAGIQTSIKGGYKIYACRKEENIFLDNVMWYFMLLFLGL